MGGIFALIPILAAVSAVMKMHRKRKDQKAIEGEGRDDSNLVWSRYFC